MPILYSRQNRKNAIINGCFRNWARNTTQTINGYKSDDRWYNSVGYTSYTPQFSRQTFSLGHTDVPGNPKYYAMCYSGGPSSDTGFYVCKEQRIEDVRTFANEIVTLSFSAMSPYPTRQIGIELIQSFGTGSTSTSIYLIGAEVFQISNVWSRYNRTIQIPSVVGKDIRDNSYLCVKFWINSGTSHNIYVGNAPYPIYLSNVQLEPGNEITPFEYRTDFKEQTLCERYYEYAKATSTGYGGAGVAEQLYIRFRQRKRSSPTMNIEDLNSPNNIDANTINFNFVDKKGAKCWFNVVNNGKWWFNPFVSASCEL